MAKDQETRPNDRPYVPRYGPLNGPLKGSGERRMMRVSELAKIPTLREMTPTECRFVILARIQLNLQNTGHPLHHLTASGVVVDSDPTLEHLISKLTDAAPAVPVDRLFYGFDATAE